MCTVTYLPRPLGGFILTHNRDEAPARSPQSIVRAQTAQDTLLFPRDTQAGGTWIATSRSGRSACLLNGAFVKHAHQPPYRRSRGLLLLDFFDWESPDRFFEHYELDGIEPFTFLYFNDGWVVEFRWDGQQRHLKNLPANRPHFWCSSTLYSPEMQARREQVFRDWLAQEGRDGEEAGKAIFKLHIQGSVQDPENDYIMNRGGKVQTVSITQLVVDEKNAQMKYYDLLGRNRSKRRLTKSKRRPLNVNR